MTAIKFPIAKSASTGKLVNAIDVHSDHQEDWICFACGEKLVGVNRPENKQAAHFRHEVKCPMGANFESYIHWLAKEVFPNIHSFVAPSIYSCFSSELRSDIQEKKYKLIKDLNLPAEISRELIIKDTYPLEPVHVKDFKVSCEQVFKSDYGDVRVDIVLEIGDRKILIEPYLSNPIDSIKYEKLIDLDYSVLEICLKDFVSAKSHHFTVQEFTDFLIKDLHSKTWIHIMKVRLEKLIDQELNYYKDIVKTVHDKLPEYHELIRQQNLIQSEIDKLHDKLSPLYQKQHEFVDSIVELLQGK